MSQPAVRGNRAPLGALSSNAMTERKSYMSGLKRDALEAVPPEKPPLSPCSSRALPVAKATRAPEAKQQPEAPISQATKSSSMAPKIAKDEPKAEPQWKIDARESAEREATRLAAKANNEKILRQTLAAERAETKRSVQEAQRVRAEQMRTQMRKQREALKNMPDADALCTIVVGDITQGDREAVDLEIELFEAELAHSRERAASAAAKAEEERLRGEQEGERAQVERAQAEAAEAASQLAAEKRASEAQEAIATEAASRVAAEERAAAAEKAAAFIAAEREAALEAAAAPQQG